MEIKEGQIWKTRDGRLTTPIKQNPNAEIYIWMGSVEGILYTWNEDGRLNGWQVGYLDLVELVRDVDPPLKTIDQMSLTDYKKGFDAISNPTPRSPVYNPMYESHLDEYRRGIDAIWDQRDTW